MLKHIGIVGCSAEGAALCYKTICSEGARVLGPHAHPEISMHTPSLDRYVDCLNADDISGVGKLMVESGEKLKSIGADFLICPDNTIHQAFTYAQDHTALSWLHIADVVANQAVREGYNCLALLGTKWLVDSNVYNEKLLDRGLELIKPENQVRIAISNIIMDELVNGIFKKDSIEYFISTIKDLKKQGCDAVILGCTEIPLIINEKNSPLPILDSTRLLARAALNYAT